jgi:peptidoglycan/LPS O-acetylase OafA/YrhL
MLAAVLLFCFLPVSGDIIGIVTGFYRIIFSVLCVIFVLLFWKMSVRVPSILKITLNSFGIASYSVYLLHPFVFTFVCAAFRRTGIHNSCFEIAISMCTTIIVSLVAYRFYEKPFMRLGKIVADTIGNSGFAGAPATPVTRIP